MISKITFKKRNCGIEDNGKIEKTGKWQKEKD